MCRGMVGHLLSQRVWWGEGLGFFEGYLELGEAFWVVFLKAGAIWVKAGAEGKATERLTVSTTCSGMGGSSSCGKNGKW